MRAGGGGGGGGGGRWRGGGQVGRGGRGSRGGRKNLSRFVLAGKHSAGKQLAVGWTESDPALFSLQSHDAVLSQRLTEMAHTAAQPNAD